MAAEDAFARCVRDYVGGAGVRQRLERRHAAALRGARPFGSDRTRLRVDAGCEVRYASVLPALASGPNELAPRLSAALKITHHPDLGRHLVAARDIQPGEVLICEEPFAAVLSADCRRTHCAFCMRRAPELIPCDLCSLVYFCSPSCKSRAWRKFHEHECAAAATLLEATVGDDVDGEDVLLALRIVCTAGLEQLRPFVASGVPGCLTDGRYFPNLGAVLQLESNLERLARDHLQQGCRLALHLAKCLGAPEEYAGVLLRIILGLDSNCHSLREMVRRPGRSPLFQVIGCALYPSAALCNHSCDPNLFRATHGNCTVHRARRLIRAGEMLTECYKSLFVHAPRRDRRTYCKLFYYFECGCEACVRDWPLLEDLPERPVFGKGETRLWSEFKRQLDELESQPGAQGDDVIPKQQLAAHVQLLNFLVTNDKRLCRLSFHLEKQIQNFYSAQGNCYFKTGEE